jgi:hypothetical protein
MIAQGFKTPFRSPRSAGGDGELIQQRDMAFINIPGMSPPVVSARDSALTLAFEDQTVGQE